MQVFTHYVLFSYLYMKQSIWKKKLAINTSFIVIVQSILPFLELYSSEKNNISIIIIDLSDNEDEALHLGEKSRINSNYPLFGVVDVLNKNIKHKSKDFGFDLIFTKQILLKSIRKVIIHTSNQ